ncbi:MAG: ABC transporter substrate-binding protein [Ruminococcaceae bacterium]|nr:ABC transporter substrate-binding protein [Oscillospiraceae bacterium]
MKKIISLVLCFVFFLIPLASCGENNEAPEKAKIRIAGMKGPTSIGFVGVMENNENEYEFSLEGTADAIVPKLIKGELDMAAVPANLASTLYNNTEGEIQILAVNTLGVLYILSKGEITSVSDLKGKTILATGKGTTPEYTLRYILSENGIDPDKDVTLDFKSEATEVVSALAQSEGGVAMLPQPYVTIALNKLKDFKVSIDLNEEWKKLNPDGGIVTGVLVVRKSFADENEEAVKSFLSQYKSSVESVNSDVSNTAKLVVKHGIFDNEKVIEAAIPNCNITFISGEDMINPVNKYLGVLYEQNEKSVGGKMPKEDFFRIVK